ncbi:hypothetical protein A7J42_06050 [Brucella intermedia]|nr:hypothetical protein A7J42_06050 [Brucella intermedia]RQP20919.1 MAG: hypothetical protein EAS49_01190 [Brucella intermedia]
MLLAYMGMTNQASAEAIVFSKSSQVFVIVPTMQMYVDNPSAWRDLETADLIRPLNDFQRKFTDLFHFTS